jgi:uncharacterized membrane protein
MNKFIQIGRIFFALAILALGIMQFVLGNYIVGRPDPWPWNIPGPLIWAYVGGALLIITSICMFTNKKSKLTLLLTGSLMILYVLPHIPEVVEDAFKAKFHTYFFKCLALGGGAFLLAVTFSQKGKPDTMKFFSDKGLIGTGRICLSLFFIICGIQHFQYVEFVMDLIPAYVPAHLFWTYFSAIALLAGGLGLQIPKTARLASMLSGTMVFLWCLLLHIPRAVDTPRGSGEWMGVFESLAISAIFFALAGILTKDPSQVPK